MANFLQKTIFSGPHVSEKIARSGGKAAGFDYMRLLLAVLIICFHTIVICYGTDAQSRADQSFAGVFIGLLLPMFFSLSGFLVAGSLERSGGLGVFLGLRALRIVPALVIDTLFSALVLGILFTSLPLSDYFADQKFHSYFLNILGDIHYYLPGVFDQNPSHKINGQLWTIPYELECYIALTIVAALGLHHRRKAFLGIGLAVIAALEIRLLTVASASVIDGRVLLLCFLGGVAAYLYRDKMRWNWWLFALSFIGMIVIHKFERLGYLIPITATYMTIFLGIHNPKKISLLRSGDYSYGLFLYGYPVQQLLVQNVPFARAWFGHLLLALPLSFLFAAVSWHLLEKRALAKKTWLYAAQARWRAYRGHDLKANS